MRGERIDYICHPQQVGREYLVDASGIAGFQMIIPAFTGICDQKINAGIAGNVIIGCTLAGGLIGNIQWIDVRLPAQLFTFFSNAPE